MNDLISRQAAIDEINERQRKLIYCFGFENDMVKIMDIAKSIITELPSAQPERWIPCSRRMPKDYENVLVYFEYYRYGDYNCMFSTYGIGDYSSEYDSWLVNGETGWQKLHVFAWMPLPKPYGGEE